MASLLYREDIDEVRARLTAWWNDQDIGRPAMLLTPPRTVPLPSVASRPEPEGWLTHYSTSSFDYRVYLSERACAEHHYMGEAVPFVCPDLAPNCLALYLGCQGVEMPGTVWCEPCFDDPEAARFDFDPRNFYWDFTLRLTEEQQRIVNGKALIQFPDLIEGLDTLAAMRGSEALLTDLYERPEWVHDCLRRITDRYFDYYDILYGLIRDETGGSVFWAWAPGRMAKLQCDFSHMISPEMFREFMVPVLREMCARLDYSMYHWDGPGAIPHLEHLLGIVDLDMLQWTPGAGVEPADHPRWWPLYHRILDGGKKVYCHWCGSADSLKALRREFGADLNRFLLYMPSESLREAEEYLRIAEG